MVTATIVVGNASNVTVNIKDNAYVLTIELKEHDTDANAHAEMLEKHNADKLAHPDIRELLNTFSTTIQWSSIQNKPAVYPAAEHSHDEKYPDLDGTRATGTWAIDISGSSASCSGNAATATSISDTKLTLSNGTQIWVE